MPLAPEVTKAQVTPFTRMACPAVGLPPKRKFPIALAGPVEKPDGLVSW